MIKKWMVFSMSALISFSLYAMQERADFFKEQNQEKMRRHARTIAQARAAGPKTLIQVRRFFLFNGIQKFPRLDERKPLHIREITLNES